MIYAAWESRLSKRDESGATARDHLLVAARKNSPTALRELEGPPFPEELRYLWQWLIDIRRGLGASFDGMAWLTWTALDAWQRCTGTAVEAWEARALFDLDAVLRRPELAEAT